MQFVQVDDEGGQAKYSFMGLGRLLVDKSQVILSVFMTDRPLLMLKKMVLQPGAHFAHCPGPPLLTGLSRMHQTSAYAYTSSKHAFG